MVINVKPVVAVSPVRVKLRVLVWGFIWKFVMEEFDRVFMLHWVWLNWPASNSVWL